MTQILQTLLSIGGPLYLIVAVVIIVLLFAVRMLWKEVAKEREKGNEKYIQMLKENRNNNMNVVRQMFEVVNKNTEVIAKNTETTHGLGDSIRELRTVITMSKK